MNVHQHLPGRRSHADLNDRSGDVPVRDVLQQSNVIPVVVRKQHRVAPGTAYHLDHFRIRSVPRAGAEF